MLQEGFFLRLHGEPEDRELYERLRPLEAALTGFLDGVA